MVNSPERKFLAKRAVSVRYGVTPRTIDRWIKAKVFPGADTVVNGRHYWVEQHLDQHDRRRTVEHAAGVGAPPAASG
jgi:hypothetical protein